jgi:predicted dehydrogenase
MEKPPAASVPEIDKMHAAATAAGRQVMVGFKKMFFPANEHAHRLITADDFGAVALARLEYPQYIPTVDEFERYARGPVPAVMGFLDHLCHPTSLLLYLLGMPSTLYYERSAKGAGAAIFSYDSGAVATLDFTWGSAFLDGLERTVVVSDRGRHVVVENNLRVRYHRLPFSGYGDVTDFYSAPPDRATAVWEPEFSLGQLYNKGLFALGYYGEVNEFARAVLEDRSVAKAGLDHARQLTHLFEAFGRGPNIRIDLQENA